MASNSLGSGYLLDCEIRIEIAGGRDQPRSRSHWFSGRRLRQPRVGLAQSLHRPAEEIPGLSFFGPEQRGPNLHQGVRESWKGGKIIFRRAHETNKSLNAGANCCKNMCSAV